jgi:hypothetical protein
MVQMAAFYQPTWDEEEEIVACAGGGRQEQFVLELLRDGKGKAPAYGLRRTAGGWKRMNLQPSFLRLIARLEEVGCALVRLDGQHQYQLQRAIEPDAGAVIRRVPAGIYQLTEATDDGV